MVKTTDNKIAVTGLAWTTALGNSIDKVWELLIKGHSGIQEVVSHYNLRSQKVAKVPHFDDLTPAQYLHSITTQTVQRALSDASIQNPSKKIMLIIGTSFGSRLDDESLQLSLHEWVDKIAEHYSLTPVAISTACSSASDAILTGAALIKAGFADICVCGGADILGESKRLAHSALGTMSPTMLGSFDENRDGTILGEGAGFIVLERYSEIVKHKKIYAFLSGCGSANDAAGLTAPDQAGNGIKLAIERSLTDAQIDKSMIGLINAHASGTITNDIVEATAYKTFFNKDKPLIFATKGAFGHSLGATGALEAIALILALQKQNTPPIVNLINPIEKETLWFAIKKTALVNIDYGLSLTIGFGGFNVSLIFERYLDD